MMALGSGEMNAGFDHFLGRIEMDEMEAGKRLCDNHRKESHSQSPLGDGFGVHAEWLTKWASVSKWRN
jgi:hypothetical protein